MIGQDAEGNAYLGGTFEGTVDLDPTAGIDQHTSNGELDIFVTRLNANGSGRK